MTLRLELLQRIVSKVQMESGVCEEQLNQVEGLLQMVSLTPCQGETVTANVDFIMYNLWPYRFVTTNPCC